MEKLDLTICTAHGPASCGARGLQEFSIADVSTRAGCINLVSALYIELGLMNKFPLRNLSLSAATTHRKK